MGRHAGAPAQGMSPVSGPSPRAPRSRVPRGGGIVAAVTAAIAVAAFATPAVIPGVLPGVRAKLPWFPAESCGETVVEVVVAPVVESAVGRAVASVQGRRLPDDTCLRVQVRGQSSSDTVSGSGVLPAASAPQLWVSDSSLWSAQVQTWRLQAAGSFASTPVVLAANRATVAALGWAATPPSWTAALDGTRPLAAPQLSTSTPGLLTMQALWQVAGRNTAAERRLAAALLTVGRTPGVGADEASALRTVEQGGVGQPLVATTEQAMRAINLDSAKQGLVAVYPSEGSPRLDFPILRIAPDQQSAALNAGADAVVATLTGKAGRTAARDAGFRDPDGGDPPSGVAATVRALAALPLAEQTAFLARLGAIAAPSRILVVMDVSLSMTAKVPGTGLTRLQLAGRAAAGAGNLLTDASSVGLWVFANNLNGSAPYRELLPVATLGTPEGGSTRRQTSINTLLGLDRHLTGGGTGLYRTALDAYRSQLTGYDPRAFNSVVVFTDGANDTKDKLTLAQAVAGLKQATAAAPGRPVRLIGIGIGAAANLDSLRTLAAPTGGGAYRADTPAQMQQVLYDVVANRT